MTSPLDTFEGYVVDEVIGHGGSGVVYRARHVDALSSAVALKVLDERHHDPSHMTSLLREFEYAKRASHPHVVEMYECGPGWLSMQLAGGGTVLNLTSQRDRLTALIQIASALDHAHATGIVHCDVKPLNILVLADFATAGTILTDFGIARLISDRADRRPKHVNASLPYVAPEVLRGRAPSAASDEYAFACTMVELLIGAPPFSAATEMALIDAHVNSPVPRYARHVDWVPHAFDSILAKAMAKDPDKRYGSCSEVIELIGRTLR